MPVFIVSSSISTTDDNFKAEVVRLKCAASFGNLECVLALDYINSMIFDNRTMPIGIGVLRRLHEAGMCNMDGTLSDEFSLFLDKVYLDDKNDDSCPWS